MNEPTDSSISLSSTPMLSVVGIYDDTGLVWGEVSTSSVSGFPWVYILRSPACTLPVATSVSVFGISSTTNDEKVTLLTNDELGLKATESSQTVVNISRYTSSQDTFVALPESLMWLYGDKPYIPQTYLSAIYSDLVKAIDDGEATDSLYRYIRSHTVKTPISDVLYKSFGDYVDTYGLLDVKPSYVRIKLGTTTVIDEEFIDSEVVDNLVTLADNSATEFHLVVQRRIGVATAVYDTTVIADDPIRTLHLGYSAGGDLYSDISVDESTDITVTLTKLFSLDERLPVVCNPSYVSVSRSVPLNVLTGSNAVSGLPSVSLRTMSGTWATHEIKSCNGETAIYLDDKYITTEPMTGDVYIEYLTSEY